jgi:hypothetical protein
MSVRQLWVQAEDYVPDDDRLMFASLLPAGDAGPVGSRIGVRDIGDLRLTMVSAQAGIVTRGAAYIPWARSIYLAVNDADHPVQFGNADPTSARIDLVVIRVFDAEQSGEDREPEITVVAGQASQNPVAPAVPTGALALWEVRYNAGSTAPIVTDRRGRAVADSYSDVRVWTTLRAADNTIAASAWGQVASLVIPAAQALPGLYLITTTMFLTLTVSTWTRMHVNGILGPGCQAANFNAAGAVVISRTGFHQVSTDGVALTVAADAGFGMGTVVARANSVLTVARLIP